MTTIPPSDFVDILGFELVEDSPSVTTDGKPKRWVVVRPLWRPDRPAGCLLVPMVNAKSAVVGEQHGGRVGFFLRVDDFSAAQYEKMVGAGVEFARPPPHRTVRPGGSVPGHSRQSLGPDRAGVKPTRLMQGLSRGVRGR